MFKRLSALFLLLAATIVVSPPAYAAPLTVNYVSCQIGSYYAPYNMRYFTCYASVSGGSGSYTYQWRVNSSRQKFYTVPSTTDTMEAYCHGPESLPVETFSVTVRVQDLSGALVSRQSATYTCGPQPV